MDDEFWTVLTMHMRKAYWCDAMVTVGEKNLLNFNSNKVQQIFMTNRCYKQGHRWYDISIETKLIRAIYPLISIRML